MIPVLAVDDMPANLHALGLVLQDLPIELDCAASAEEGLSLLLEKDYAIALIDVQMPGMNGFEMAELMRAHKGTEHVPIIFITAGSSKQDFVFRGYEVGAVDYLIKPYEPAFLNGKVRVFLELYKARKELAATLVSEREAVESLREVNEDLSRFAAVAAHDLRAPLTKSQRMLSMFRLKFGDQIDDEKALRTLERVERSMKQMGELVNGLYDLYSLVDRDLQKRKVLLVDVVTEAECLLSDAIESSQAVVEYGELPVVFGDPALIRQAIQNLIGNAVKYSRDGVPPHIRIEAHLSDDGSEHIITVSDNGEGFEADVGKQIFAPFSRLAETQDREGLGIGLATVRKIIERHDGSISATGVRGEGAVFTIHLPITEV